jgi:Protein of unknown function (DUF1579)
MVRFAMNLPKRGELHDALAMFVGKWRAEGKSYGGRDGTPEPWVSTHTAAWHTGELFLIQNERATVGLAPFDTLSILGVDPDTGRAFARTFENHGFCRDYELAHDGRLWTLTGPSERARIELSEDGKRQTIAWQWRPNGEWIALCDRVATRLSDDDVVA